MQGNYEGNYLAIFLNNPSNFQDTCITQVIATAIYAITINLSYVNSSSLNYILVSTKNLVLRLVRIETQLVKKKNNLAIQSKNPFIMLPSVFPILCGCLQDDLTENCRSFKMEKIIFANQEEDFVDLFKDFKTSKKSFP